MDPIVAPVMTGADRISDELPVYYSQLYVRSDSDIVSVDQLQGKILAYNDEASLSGLHCLSFFIKALVQSYSFKYTLPFFASVVRTGAHRNSLRAVIDGSADVLALDCNLLTTIMRVPEGQELMSRLRALSVPALSLAVDNNDCFVVSKDGLLGPNPAQPIVVQKRMATENRINLTQALLSLPPNILADIGADRFVEVTERYYEPIRRMLETCDAHSVVCTQLSQSLVTLRSFECSTIVVTDDGDQQNMRVSMNDVVSM